MSPRTFRALFLSIFFWLFGFGLYDDLFPIYVRSLGATAIQLGTLFTLRQIAFTAGVVLGGVLSDRYNRRTVMVASWLVGAPVPALFLLAHSWTGLLPSVLLFEATVFGLPAFNAYITERSDPAKRASTFAAIGAASSMGLLVSPALGGFVAQHWGIRATFVLGAASYVVSTVFILLLEGGERPGGRETAWREALRLTGLRPVARAVLVLGIMSGVTLGIAPFVSPFLREVRGLTLTQIGALGSVISGGGLLSVLVMGRLADRWGVPRALTIVLLLIAAGNLLVAFGPVALLPLAFFIKTRAPIQPLSQAVIAGAVPLRLAGRVFGLIGAVWGVTGAAAAFLSGVAYKINPGFPLIGGGVLCLGFAALVAAGRQGIASIERKRTDEWI